MRSTPISKAHRPFWTAVHEAADRMTARMRRQFLEAIESVRDGLSLRRLTDLIRRNDPDPLGTLGVVDDLERALGPAFRETVEDVVYRSAQGNIGALPARARLGLSFQITNPEAVRAVDTVVRGSLDRIVGANRPAVERLIREGFTEGRTPRATARLIRSHIGLNARQSLALSNFAAAMDEAGVPAGTAAKRLATYERRLLADRADMIARTETINAATAGQQALWEKAVTDGLLPQGSITSRQFVTGSGGVAMRPPAHPKCRCSLALRFAEDGRAVVVWVMTPDDRLCPICAPIPSMQDNQVAGIPAPRPIPAYAGGSAPRARDRRPAVPA